MGRIRNPERNRQIGRNLRRLRLQRGLRLQTVAEIAGVTYQQMQKYETGVNRLPLALVPVLSDFFGVSSDAFFRDEVTLPAVTAEEGDTFSLCRAIVAVEDPVLRRKIHRVVEILTA